MCIYIYICEFPFNVGLAGAASAVGIREVGEFTFVGACQHQDGATKTTPQPILHKPQKQNPTPHPTPKPAGDKYFKNQISHDFAIK